MACAPKEIPQQYIPATHTHREKQCTARGSLGIFHPCLRPLKAPGSTLGNGRQTSHQPTDASMGGTSCRAGRANAPPDFDARGREMVLPSHFSMASLPMVRLKFGKN